MPRNYKHFVQLLQIRFRRTPFLPSLPIISSGDEGTYNYLRPAPHNPKQTIHTISVITVYCLLG